MHGRALGARGFTLLEMIIALSLAAAVLTMTVAVLFDVSRDSRRNRVRAAMSREGTFIGELLALELRQAGAGVPRGAHIQDSYGGAGTTEFYANVIVAGTDQIGIVGDFPRPDANYNTFGILDGAQASTGDRLVGWHTENNGTCMP